MLVFVSTQRLWYVLLLSVTMVAEHQSWSQGSIAWHDQSGCHLKPVLTRKSISGGPSQWV